MTTQPIHVRNVPTPDWRAFKAEATRRGMTLAAALAEAMRAWRDRKEPIA